MCVRGWMRRAQLHAIAASAIGLRVVVRVDYAVIPTVNTKTSHLENFVSLHLRDCDLRRIAMRSPINLIDLRDLPDIPPNPDDSFSALPDEISRHTKVPLAFVVPAQPTKTKISHCMSTRRAQAACMRSLEHPAVALVPG
jgi:hypothetical protein